MSETPSSEGRLSKEEVETILRELSPADWKRAELIATLFCGGLIGWTSDDLIQETLCSLLAGTRVWRTGVPPLVVLKNVMRSIASNARKSNEVSPIDQNVTVDGFEVNEGDETLVAYGKVVTTPEDELSGKQQIAALYSVVDRDEELKLLVMAWADGLRGAEARDALAWDGKKYDAARKRLQRRLNTLDSGWRST